MTVNSRQLYNAPFLYMTGLNLTVGTTTLTVSSGRCRDSSNEFDMVLGASTALNGAVNGLNGLDTSSLAASTWYYLYLIADPNGYAPTGLILSTSASGSGIVMPNSTIPGGSYSISKWLYAIVTNSSAEFVPQTVFSNANGEKVHFYTSGVKVLTDGGSTGGADIDLSPAVPPINPILYKINTNFTADTAGDKFLIYPKGATTTVPPTGSGVVAAKEQWAQSEVQAAVVSSKAQSTYKTDSASDKLTVYVDAYKYSVVGQ